MRQEMGKTTDKGSRKLDQTAQKNYKEFGQEQAKKAPIAETVKAATGSAPVQEKQTFGNWRKGDFSSPPQEEPQQMQEARPRAGGPEPAQYG